jgi:predicted  nucleic acid-binding Zn-ribbon protein
MTRVADLYALQEIDSALGACKSSLAEVEAGLGEEGELVDIRQQAQERQEALREVEKQQREQEWQIDDLRQKIEPLEKKLYGGTIRNPKELADLQQDVESLKRRQRGLEDRDLEIMVAVEEAQKEAEEAQRALAEAEEAWNAEQERLQQEQASLRQEIEGLEARRTEQARLIEPATLRLYDALRDTRQGIAVAKVERGTCQACRISLPMNVLHRARSGAELVQCTSCERILYLS